MKNLIVIIALLTNFLVAQTSNLVWKGESEELGQFIKSENEQAVIFALQMIITMPEVVEANKIGYDIYKLFKSHNNDKIRQMALVALYKMEHYFLLSNLKKDVYLEKNKKIRNLIHSILQKIPVLSNIN